MRNHSAALALVTLAASCPGCAAFRGDAHDSPPGPMVERTKRAEAERDARSREAQDLRSQKEDLEKLFRQQKESTDAVARERDTYRARLQKQQPLVLEVSPNFDTVEFVYQGLLVGDDAPVGLAEYARLAGAKTLLTRVLCRLSEVHGSQLDLASDGSCRREVEALALMVEDVRVGAPAKRVLRFPDGHTETILRFPLSPPSSTDEERAQRLVQFLNDEIPWRRQNFADGRWVDILQATGMQPLHTVVHVTFPVPPWADPATLTEAVKELQERFRADDALAALAVEAVAEENPEGTAWFRAPFAVIVPAEADRIVLAQSPIEAYAFKVREDRCPKPGCVNFSGEALLRLRDDGDPEAQLRQLPVFAEVGAERRRLETPRFQQPRRLAETHRIVTLRATHFGARQRFFELGRAFLYARDVTVGTGESARVAHLTVRGQRPDHSVDVSLIIDDSSVVTRYEHRGTSLPERVRVNSITVLHRFLGEEDPRYRELVAAGLQSWFPQQVKEWLDRFADPGDALSPRYERDSATLSETLVFELRSGPLGALLRLDFPTGEVALAYAHPSDSGDASVDVLGVVKSMPDPDAPSPKN
jgi:hypothetical protein